MHQILEVVFPIIVLLYLVDCIAYVGPQHLLFSSYLGRWFKLKKPGLHPVGLLPISEAVLSHNLPILFTSRGIYTAADKYCADNARYQARNLRFTAYEDVVTVEADGKVVRVNGEALIKFPSATNAKLMRDRLWELKCLEVPVRHEKIREFLDQSADLQKIRVIRQKYHPFAYIKILSSVLFVNVFGILPLAVYSQLSSDINLSAFMFLALGIYVVVLVATYIARRRLFGTASGQTILAMMPVILSPVTVMHALKDLTKETYTGFDYLAMAAEFLPSNAFQNAMREEFLRVTFAKEDEENAELYEFLSLRQNVLRGLLNNTGNRVQELLAAPKQRDPSAASYCPLCLTEYRPEAEKCPDCGIGLKKFDDNALGAGHSVNSA